MSEMSRSERAQRAALRREGEQYKSAGMTERVALVNAQLRNLGEDPIPVDKTAMPAVRQKRTSTQAATRQKRSAD
jgi:hypothetical protein